MILATNYPKVFKSVNFSDSSTDQYNFGHHLPQSPPNLSISQIPLLTSIILATIYPKVPKSVNFLDSYTDL